MRHSDAALRIVTGMGKTRESIMSVHYSELCRGWLGLLPLASSCNLICIPLIRVTFATTRRFPHQRFSVV